MKTAVFIHLAALLLAQFSLANVKTVAPTGDEILEIKTALGIATIIQMPDFIQSAIIGDQSAYRIESVDKAVTIKPLRFGAKTNLYLFTQKKRFNLRLETVPQERANYIVYIKEQEVGRAPLWRSINKTISGKRATWKLLRLATTQDGFLLLDLELTPKESIKVQPSDFWVRQGAISKTMNSLFLSRTDLQRGQINPVAMSIPRAEISNRDLDIGFEGQSEKLRITLPKELLWK